MKMKFLCLSSLTSLAVMGATLAHADQDVRVPTLAGGPTVTIGTFFVVPSAANDTVALSGNDPEDETGTFVNADSDYNFGWEASIGYVFNGTANGIELSYRGLSTDDSETVAVDVDNNDVDYFELDSKIEYEYNGADLLISQFVDIGDRMQMRVAGGLA